MQLSAILTNCISCQKMLGLLLGLIIINLHMCLQNGFLPNIMSEICMVNNELHDHFLHTIKGSNHVSTQSFNHIGPRIWNPLQKKVNILVPIAKFKELQKVFFQEHILEWNYSK